MTKLIESETVERAYGFHGTNAIVESNYGNRLFICDGFGGTDTLDGGAVRWRQGMVVKLQPGDTLESLRAARWNDEVSLFDAVVNGEDNTRPILAGVSPTNLADSVGLV